MNQQLKAKRHRATVFLGTAVGAAALAAGIYMLTIGRPPLIGERHHDFGVITIPAGEPEGVASHTFTLTNRLSEPIRIMQVRTSCGCTASRYSPSVVEPGQQLEVEVGLSVSKNGLSEQKAYIDTADHGVQTLYVSGVGREQQQLRSGRSEVTLRDDTTEVLVAILADVWPGDLPEGQAEPRLAVDGGEWLDVDVRQWERQREANEYAHTPAIWSGIISVKAKPGAIGLLRRDTFVTISMVEEHVLEVPVVLAPPIEPKPEPLRENTEPVDEDPLTPLQFEPGTAQR